MGVHFKKRNSLESVIDFLSIIFNVHQLWIDILKAFSQLLTNCDYLIQGMMRKLAQKLFNQSILAKLVNKLEEEIFDSPHPSIPICDEKRKELAMVRICEVSSNLGRILSYCQNTMLNKQLIYCLIDVIAVEVFPEFFPNSENSLEKR